MTADLRLGDCLDPVTGLASLADGSVDHVICDPPYSEATHGKDRGNELGGLHRLLPITFSAVTDEQRATFAAQVARIVTRWVLVFCDAEGIDRWRLALCGAGLEHVRVGFWVKGNPAPQFSGDKPGTGAEAIVIAHQTRGGKPKKKRWNGGGRCAVWMHMVVNNARTERMHETQKPVDLMDALIRDFTDPGDLVLDPFAGSGTTGVACIRNGRRFVGWEKDEKYHAIATRRLAATREQLALDLGGAA